MPGAVCEPRQIRGSAIRRPDVGKLRHLRSSSPSSTPMPRSTAGSHARKRAITLAKLSMANAATRNGMPRPAEYTASNARALGDGLLGCGERQDRREDRPDAGRPAERKGQPHHIGAPQPDRLRHRQALLPHQNADPRQPEEMQAHDDDDDAGDDRQFLRPGAQQRDPRGWRWRRVRRKRWKIRRRRRARRP